MKTLNKNIEKILNRNKDRKYGSATIEENKAKFVQTNKYGKHYITDGCILVEFKKDIPELSNYKILDYEQSFKLDDVFDKLIGTSKFEHIGEQDKFMLEHINSYNKFYKECIKGQEGYYQYKYVVLQHDLPSFYNADLLKEAIDFIGVKNLADTTISRKVLGYSADTNQMLVIENDTLKIGVMPIRYEPNSYDSIKTNNDLFKTYIESKGL